MLLSKGVTKSAVPFFLLFITFVFNCHLCKSEKIRYATDKYCDRHSLDAVYHEKYKLITNNIFADIKEFVSRVSELMADSLTSVMANLPDRDVSDIEEKKVYTQFKNVKSAFSSKIKKSQKNITSAWEELMTSNFDLMFDNGKSSLEDYLSKIIRMTESYSGARRTLDSTLSTFVHFIKSTVRDGFMGIKLASEEAIRREEEERKKNETEGATTTEESVPKNKNKDEIEREKMVEIAKMIVPGFLGKVTVEVIKRKMDLSKATGVDPENRDSVLDDMLFDMQMVKTRISAFIHSDVPRDKGATDLARRSIYTHWADLAEEMYKEKLQAKKSADKSNTGRLYYRNLWKDEDEIVETLLNLMDVYP